MKYALFLGCTIPARGRNYEVSARKVASALGVELVDLDHFVCCGFPVKSADAPSSLLLAAYNLALAKEKGLDICTLCSSCTSALAESVHDLSRKGEEAEVVNERLKAAGLRYQDPVKVRHFARILYEEIGLDELRRSIKRPLGRLRVAIHYGCHYLKPSEAHERFDSVENPRTLDDLTGLTGAVVVDYLDRKKCCGGPLLPVDEKTSILVAKQKLDKIKEAGADAICLVCPFCAVMFDGNQKTIEAEFQIGYDLPVLYLPQLLGLAMGFDPKELGFNMNVVKTKKLLEAVGSG